MNNERLISNSQYGFMLIMANAFAIDSRAGGLVLGRTHEEGGIESFRFFEDLQRFEFNANVENGEYIVNYASYKANENRFNEINQFKEMIPLIDSLKITRKTRILNTHANPTDKLLFFDSRGTFIINKFATAKFFNEIEALNESNNDFVSCDNTKIIPSKDADQRHPAN